MYTTINIADGASDYWKNRFESYREKMLVKYCDHPMIENYDKTRLQIEKQVGFFLTVNIETHEIAKFSTVFHPKHWPKEVVRIYNRTWVDPAYRASGLQQKRDFTKQEYFDDQMSPLEQQILCAKNHGAELVVLSREFTSGFVNRAPAISKLMNQRDRKWVVDRNNVYLTVKSRSNASCWQMLIYHELVENSANWLNRIPSMTIEKFKRKFSHDDCGIAQ